MARTPCFDELLTAAQAVLAARADGMLTSVEWDALDRAAEACNTLSSDASAAESFRIEHGAIIRTVVPKKGSTYEHTCTLAVFEAVCHAIDELAGQPTALDDLVARTGLPHSQVNTALAFLKERGCLVPVRGRKHTAATGSVHLDAMTEYHALREAATDA